MSDIYIYIDAKDDEFININNKYEKILDKFQAYEEGIVSKKGVKPGNNRAGSYKNYVVRSLYLYKNKFKSLPDQLDDIDVINQLLSFKDEKGFKELNEQHHRFYQASINSFVEFLLSTHDDLIHKITNFQFVQNTNYNSTTKAFNKYKKNIKQNRHPINKRPSKQTITSTKYPRNSLVKETVKELANWKCEYDPSHITFINDNDHHPYVEAHHLIPMSAQDNFENSIDFADNMISLCPTCHRKIHLAEKEDRKHMIEHFYNLRKDKYKAHGIKITLEELLSFYDI